jgi:hypothetical protein
MVIVAVFYIPTRLDGWGHIFETAQTHFAAINPATKKPFGAIADKTTAANVKQAGGNAQLAVPTCASRCSRAGSPGSRSRASSALAPAAIMAIAAPNLFTRNSRPRFPSGPR